MTRKDIGLLLSIVSLSVAPVWAHHSLDADYDAKKPATSKGTVVRFDWSNPHVAVFVDVAEANGSLTTWEYQFGSTLDMKKAGWSRDSLKIGDVVTAEGSLARDGSKRALGKMVTVGGKKLAAGSIFVETVSKAAAKPAPRLADGHVRFGATATDKGYWSNPSATSLAETSAGNIRMNVLGLLANLADAGKVAPFQPWAKGLYEYRQKNLLADDPMQSCLPAGGPRQLQVPYGLQIVDQPDRQRIFLFSGGANRNWRMIPMDGRALPDVESETPTYFGFSVGKWDGDTLVATSTGYNERFWFSNGGLPHTESLKLTERFSRPDYNTLKYEVTIDDPGAYTRPWTSSTTLTWVPNREIDEYFCDDYNRVSEESAGHVAAAGK